MAWECGCGVANSDFKSACGACGTPKGMVSAPEGSAEQAVRSRKPLLIRIGMVLSLLSGAFGLLMFVVRVAGPPTILVGEFQMLSEAIRDIAIVTVEGSVTIGRHGMGQINIFLINSPFNESEGGEQAKIASEVAELVKDNYSRIDEIETIAVGFLDRKNSIFRILDTFCFSMKGHSELRDAMTSPCPEGSEPPLGPWLTAGELTFMQEVIGIISSLLLLAIAYGFWRERPWSRRLVIALCLTGYLHVLELFWVSDNELQQTLILNYVFVNAISATIFLGIAGWYFYFKANVVAYYQGLAKQD